MDGLFWLSQLEGSTPKSRSRVEPQGIERHHVQRHGLRWVDAPAAYGPYKTLYNRFRRWSEKGIFQLIFSELFSARMQGQAGVEPKEVLRMPPTSKPNCLQPQKGGAAPRLIGRTKGGLTSKLLLKGRPVRLHLSEGQCSDFTGADLPKARVLIGDKGYDSNKIRTLLLGQGVSRPDEIVTRRSLTARGCTRCAMGFTFNDSSDASDETSGTPSPIKTMERLTAEAPENQDVIFPLIGSEEVNNSPTHAYHRYVINFGGRREEECRQQWPELMKIVERKVKPGRIGLPPKNAWNKQVAAKWWLFGADRKELALAIDGCDHVLVCPGGSTATKHFSFAFLSPNQVYLNTLCVFRLGTYDLFGLLTSRLHDDWSRFNCATLGDGLRYNSSACFETFPFPVALLERLHGSQEAAIQRQTLESLGKHYYQFRADLMVNNNEGLTSTYNRFHDPEETDSQIMELRRLHGEMDQAVLNSYGWSDMPITCGFGLDYLDMNEDTQLPDELQDRIDSGDLFFRDAEDAIAFQAQLKAHGAISARKKLPWRYRWPDAVRDDVLARLLALNAERYAEEVAQGLHSGKKKAATASGKSGRRRGRPPKTPQSSQGESLDLR